MKKAFLSMTLRTIVKGIVNSFVLYGSYRKMLELPKDLDSRLVSFDQWNDDLLSIDSEKELYAVESQGEKKALILQFSLSKSCYATMLVREIIHGSGNLSDIPKEEKIDK